LLTAFVLTPILYTLVMSTYNYKTGNYIGKEEALGRIQALALEPDENATAFDIVVGEYQSSPAILVSDINNNAYFISTPNEKIALDAAKIEIDENQVAQDAEGFTALDSGDISSSDAAKKRFFFDGTYFIVVEFECRSGISPIT
jgi:arabinogalactan oligomer/maltooligosaccharide transport system permease protein